MPNLTKSFIDEHIEMRGVEYLEEAIAEDKGCYCSYWTCRELGMDGRCYGGSWIPIYYNC